MRMGVISIPLLGVLDVLVLKHRILPCDDYPYYVHKFKEYHCSSSKRKIKSFACLL